jgi:hypothetical protein
MTLRNLKRVAAVVLASCGLFVSTAAVSSPDHEDFIYNDADEDKTQEIGGEFHGCHGEYARWGDTWIYSEYVEAFPCT